jgi:acetyltransferase-like isoleucine patch superfamily enzyme
MDNDSHPIYDNLGNLINAPKSISVGNHVWIGCRSLVLKGSYIPDDVVIAADSTITKKMTESHCIIGGKGHDVHVLKHDVNWNS